MGEEDKAARQEAMTKALDSWILKYCEKELQYKIEDSKIIGWDSITATQEPGQQVWTLAVKGSIAGGGPNFEGVFSMKQDEEDGQWMVRKDKFGKAA